jgi:E3 ubiquitin-protein ligase FANCL
VQLDLAPKRLQPPAAAAVAAAAPGPLHGARFSCDPELHALLREHRALVQQRLERSGSVQQFLSELRAFAVEPPSVPRGWGASRRLTTGHALLRATQEKLLQAAPQATLPPPQYYQRLLGELERVGWQSVAGLDASLSRVQLRLSDAAGRSHVLDVRLPRDYPETPPQCVADLPLAVDLRWDARASSLASLVQHCRALVDELQDFFVVTEDFDKHTWVLEPDPPMRSSTLRRVAIGRNASLQIEIDPRRPRTVCDCRFLGADSVVGPLRQLLNRNVQNWDERDLPRLNLQRLLQLELPSRAATKREDFSAECGICYAYRLDQALPDVVCENVKCSRPFHRVCLFEWLKALPNSRQSFSTVFGACPYCSSPITVSSSSSSTSAAAAAAR